MCVGEVEAQVGTRGSEGPNLGACSRLFLHCFIWPVHFLSPFTSENRRLSQLLAKVTELCGLRTRTHTHLHVRPCTGLCRCVCHGCEEMGSGEMQGDGAEVSYCWER